MEYGVQKLGMKRIVAITSIDNVNSGKLLEKVGLRFENNFRLRRRAKVIRV